MKVVGSSRQVSVVSQTALAAAASGLAAGGSVSFAGPTWGNSLDVQWQCSTFHYDPIRGEGQIMGKPASSQSLLFSHYLYTESSNSWVQTTSSNFGTGSGNGHLWNHAFDPATGDYFFCISAQDHLQRWDRATQTWTTTSADPVLLDSLSVSSWGGIAWHPNLFGAGDGGVVVRATKYAACWRRADDTWQAADGVYSDGTPHRAHTGGGDYVYFSDVDRVIVGTGSNSAGSGGQFPMQGFDAGAAGVVTTPSLTLSEPPTTVYGAGGTTNTSKMVVDPNDPTAAMLIERNGPSRVWRSTDYGVTWNLLAYTHPFRSMSGNPGDLQNWTMGAVPGYGVIWGFHSGHDGGGADAVIWKPND